MLQTFEAIYEHGQFRWLDTPPNLLEARLLVTVLPASAAKPADAAGTPGNALADALHAAVRLNPFRDVADPAAWQREMRQDRPLAGRE
jgi:hypothetical protein